MTIFENIKAAKFFPNYCPQVKNWKHKSRGISGKGKELKFSKEDYKHIKKSWLLLKRDIDNYLKNTK